MKLIPYGHQSLDADDIEKASAVLRSDFITQGPKIKEFERVLCEYAGARYAVAVSSGTAALHIACLAGGIKPGDEVITSPMTFAASANCVLYCGGKPIFADIQEDTANINPDEIKKNITPKTRVIIPVHFAGHPCDLEEISRLAKRHSLIIIEDAAHALGGKYKGSKIGSCKYSDMSIFSFHPVKAITTGEGGAVLTNKKELYEKLLMLRNHGITKNIKKTRKSDAPWYYEMRYLGFNYRITDFQCALGISQLKKLDRFIKIRSGLAQIYNKRLSRIMKIDLPIERPYVHSAWHLYAVRINGKDRKKMFYFLRKQGIAAQVHYIPVYLHPYYKRLGYKNGLCPSAEKFYKEEVSLPLYPSLGMQRLNYIIKKLMLYFEAA